MIPWRERAEANRNSDLEGMHWADLREAAGATSMT